MAKTNSSPSENQLFGGDMYARVAVTENDLSRVKEDISKLNARVDELSQKIYFHLGNMATIKNVAIAGLGAFITLLIQWLWGLHIGK